MPVTALIGTLVFKQIPSIIDPKQATLVALTVGVLFALATCYAWLRPAPAAPFREGLRLMDDIGWAAVLPQMLASLGAVFAISGVGEVVGGIAGQAIPQGSLIGAVIGYGLGMALFTMVMGNAFAAFPVMAAAIGLPLLVQRLLRAGADPEVRDSLNRSPREIAVMRGFIDVAGEFEPRVPGVSSMARFLRDNG